MNDFDTNGRETFPPGSDAASPTGSVKPHFLHLFVPRQSSDSSQVCKTLATIQRESEARWATYSLAGYTVEFVKLLNEAQQEHCSTEYAHIRTLVEGSHLERESIPFGD